MDWKDIYKSRVVTADEAVKKIKSGDRVVFGHAAGEPKALVDAMVRNASSYKNVEIVHMVAMGKGEYCNPEYAGNFTHNALFAGGPTRKAIHEGRALFTPCHFSKIPSLFTEKILPVDVMLMMLSQPDEHGYCSYGVSVDYTKPAAESAKLVIAEVTPHMPRTFGESVIHISEIDCIVETDSKPAVLNSPELSANDEKIGRNIAELIRDGDCLQLGIGAVPDAILNFLTDKKDLGIHSEMISDGVVNLVEKGIINCSKKNFHHGRIVVTFLMGTEKLYKFVNNNPLVEMFPVNYVNNPAIVARNDNMVSVNSALQVDFTGQVVSDTIGYKQYSGTGGQLDFVRGAAWSNGGRSILAFSSTASGGKLSRIVPHIDEGASVTTPRTDTHYIVTEYGIADLRGKSVVERGKALIKIAHPDFREELAKSFFEIYRKAI
ncbi:MAG TPA: acetyl-CoA hydrolase/transferase C-terminal domain-containing protein [Spirochaetota bacterium]|nr:acetyl-CoA hydrolase/transferase C-terminal domain-containing protein [Spirochaetota bacterium]HPS85585.1 acetyl-CoA hydrolase/transferase C-terminal domain-containing protein [Spirochaetota bacterium]